PPRSTLRLVNKNGGRVEVEARASARSTGQPVTELHLLVDGRPVRLGTDRFARKVFKPARENTSELWKVTLEPGLRKLSVRAMSRDSYSISDEVLVDVPPTVAPPKKRGTLHYVGIGINQFKKHPSLALQGAVP